MEELDTFGAEDNYDTSAALPMDAPVHTTTEDMSSGTGKRRWCLCIVIAAITLGAVAAFLGLFFSLRGNSGEPLSTQPTVPSEPSAKPRPAATPPPLTPPPVEPPVAKHYRVSVERKFPHDVGAFTQGFEYANGFFFESTGLRGQSTLRKVEIETGKVLHKLTLKDLTLFGEGLTLYKDQYIFMLTWQAGRGFIFNQSTFDVIREWKYKGEGWALTMDREKNEVYMSDGSSFLRVLEPVTMKELRRVKVTLDKHGVNYLNEIEWVCGEVWANVWLSSLIYRIDPVTGFVKAVIDARNLPLQSDRNKGMNVLNGIAFDKETGRLWLTGKKWSTVYEVSTSDTSLDLKKCK